MSCLRETVNKLKVHIRLWFALAFRSNHFPSFLRNPPPPPPKKLMPGFRILRLFLNPIQLARNVPRIYHK